MDTEQITRIECVDRAIEIAKASQPKLFTTKDIVASARALERYVNGKPKKNTGGEV